VTVNAVLTSIGNGYRTDIGRTSPGSDERPMLSLLSVLVGAVLGLRFRVLVLVPAIGCAILASSFFSHDLAHGALASLFAVIGLQIGIWAGSSRDM
jgi:hypothetical protein